MKNSILLISGILITLLTIFLSAHLYEMLYYDNEFSNEMYNEHLYIPVALVTALVAWVLAGIYYYVINSVRFSRWYHWLIMLLVAIVLAPTINYTYPDSVFSSLGYDFSAQLFNFSMANLVVEGVLFVVASYSIRWWSSNCRHTPIPE